MIWLTFLLAGWSMGDVGAAKGCVGKDEVCSKCTCSENTTEVDCQGLNLLALPEILPSNLIYLNMYKNQIITVDQNAFKNCHSLSVIVLAENKITNLPDGLFDETPSLAKLNVHGNPLIMNESSLVFSPLNLSLKFLSIYNNTHISEKIFKNLFGLNHLMVSGNISGGFGKSFSSLKSLERLELFPPLKRITDKTFLAFKQCKKINKLNLEYLDLSFIEEKAFIPFKNLACLQLGHNPQLNLIKVSKTFKYLPNNIRRIDAAYLVNNFWPTNYLNETFHENLKDKSNLETLKLNKNSLLYIDMGFPRAVKHLKYLDISFNRLGNIFGLATLMFTMVNLTDFNANFQMKRALGGEKESNRMHPSDEFLAQTTKFSKKRPYENAYSDSTCVAKLPVKCIFPLSSERLEDSSWCMACTKKLNVTFLNSIMDENLDNLPPVLLLGDCVLTTVEFGLNGIKKMIGPIIVDRPRAKKPLRIDFSYNGINCFAPDLFDISIRRGLNIGKINLEANELSDQLIQDVDGKTFAFYTNLTWLNLANNRLKQLHSNTFMNLVKLEVLNLSRNSLQTLDINLSKIPCIRILDLSSNLFVIFSSDHLKAISSLSAEKGYSNFKIYLAENPFQCNCDSIHFLLWVMENTTNVDKIETVHCLKNSKRISLDQIYDINKNLKMECHYYLISEIVGGLLAMAIVCIMIGVTFHKYKWDIRYYMLKMTQKRKKYKLWLEMTTNYAYDAFVSYDQNDRPWIVQELIPNLEIPQSETESIKKEQKTHQMTEAARESCSNLILSSDNDEASPSNSFDEISDNFKFCIHERDFEAGNIIEANIMSAIESSRKVLLVVSRHFVKSKWCRLELEMAKMESLERGRNIVVIVFLEPVEETLESLDWLTKRYTFLQWPACCDSSKLKEFWKRLRTALNEADPEKIVCQCGKNLSNK